MGRFIENRPFTMLMFKIDPITTATFKEHDRAMFD